MLLPFWLKLLTSFLLGLSFSSQASDQLFSAGIIESLEELSSIEKNQVKKDLVKFRSNPITSLDNIFKIRLHPSYVNSILFHSPKKYINLLSSNSSSKKICKIIQLLDLKLLRASPVFDQIVISFIDQKGKTQSGVLSRQSLIDSLRLGECSDDPSLKKELENRFQITALKRTIKGISFTLPKVNSECSKTLNEWKKNEALPYLCQIDEIIKRSSRSKPSQFKSSQARYNYNEVMSKSRSYKSILSFFQRSYISNLCDNLDNEKRFCSTYISNDIWAKVINGEKPRYLMKSLCSQLLKKPISNINQLRFCLKEFTTNNEACSTLKSFLYPSLFPKPGCKETSQALTAARLKTNYTDCPAFVDNESIININRVIKHFKSDNKEKTVKSSCSYDVNSTYAKLHLDNDNDKGWPLKICYNHKASGEKRCKKYIPGENHLDKISESSAVSQILYENFRYKSKKGCKIIDKDLYRPALLQFKSGCFITYDAANCTTRLCPKKIILNQKEIKELTYEGVVKFDYFPTAFSNEAFSASNLLAKFIKLEAKSIKNLTQLKYFLKTHKKGIIHGTGCLEDVLPTRFKKNSLNQCSPHPFIIDGIQSENDQEKLVVRLSIDALHSPRLIKWNSIFSAIGNYQLIHPLKLWGLYGLK